ncbi:hypothetical protein J2W92_002608 [Rhizobium leguminosarum]
MGLGRFLVFFFLLLTFCDAAAADFSDDFNEPLGKGWCPCQIDNNRLPVTFSTDPENKSNSLAHITVDAGSLGGHRCKPACGVTLFSLGPETGSDATLGPMLVSPTGLGWSPQPPKADPYCIPDIVKKAKGIEEGLCIQRQELRVDESFAQDSTKPQLYSLRFRMPSKVENTKDSIRWVVAQWKAEPAVTAKGEDASPFLAQRYDDGILNVTVQDRSCRCLIASASRSNLNYPWNDGKAQYCQRTDSGPGKAELCAPNLMLEYGKNPVLTSPAGKWTEMSYRVQAGPASNSVIEVYQDGRFIVRATGHVGYDAPGQSKQKTKFKIGHYRDYIPSTDVMDLDWVRIKQMK